jgi:hypothetical protein
LISSEQQYWWRIALELKLRKSSGDAFQAFFSDMMEKKHSADFVRVRSFGKLGDKGCDGYLQSSGQVFACYGALNSDDGKVAYLITKMGDDYSKALESIAAIMKEWHMVHNLVDGLPIHAIQKLDELKNADKTRKFGFIGMEGFEERIFSMEAKVIESLLGPAATNQDAQNLQTAELRDLITAVAKDADELSFDTTTIRPVPPEKLDFNKLPNHWRHLVAGGWQNADLVRAYFDRHHDPLVGERIAQMFRVRYQYLKSQNLSPGGIMSALYEAITGIGAVLPARQVSSQALLAHLFESCDIFEDDPKKAS